MRLHRAFLWKHRLRLAFYLVLLSFWLVQWSNVSLIHKDSFSFIDTPEEPKPGESATQQYQSLPKWMKDYFQWHSRQLSSIHEHEWKWQHHRLLIVRCMDDDRCGGTSDRLKSVPLFLVLAAKSRRLLFLRWNRPFALEEFLIPNSYWNWTVPTSLATLLDKDLQQKESRHYNQTTILSKKSQQLVSAVQSPSTWLVQGNLQFSGATLYESLASEFEGNSTKSQDFVSMYHSFFHSSFAPAPAIDQIVQDIFRQLHLVPNRFVVAHIRAKYPGEVFRETGNLTALQAIVDNAICVASKLNNRTTPMPIYLASDALAVLQAGIQSKLRHGVVSRLTSQQKIAEDGDPPHLNFAQRDHPSAFYSIFVDLMIMSQSQCVAFGAGGFGRFGSLVSFNVSCRQAHSVKGVMQECSS
jgi:hypothetical protein